MRAGVGSHAYSVLRRVITSFSPQHPTFSPHSSVPRVIAGRDVTIKHLDTSEGSLTSLITNGVSAEQGTRRAPRALSCPKKHEATSALCSSMFEDEKEIRRSEVIGNLYGLVNDSSSHRVVARTTNNCGV